MAKTKEEKKQIIQELEKNLNEKRKIILLDFSDLKSDKLFDLRNKLKKSDCLLKVVKKNLLKKILEKMKEEEFLGKINEIKEQLALVFGLEDEITPSKICYQMSKEDKNLKILGGAEKNEELNQKYKVLSFEEVISLAQLPSRIELLFRLVNNLKNPFSGLVNVFKGSIKGLIYVLGKAKT